MVQINNESPQPGSDKQLREEVERLRQHLSEVESNLDESRRTIASLQKNEQLYRTILENIPPTTYVVGVGNEPLNSSIYSSPQIEKIMGHTSDEFLADPLLWMTMISPEDRDRVMAASQYADLTEGPFALSTVSFRAAVPYPGFMTNRCLSKMIAVNPSIGWAS